MTLNEIEKRITIRQGEKNILVKQTKEVIESLSQETDQLYAIEQAVEIIQCVAQATQKELEYHISEVVSLAMQAVFPRPYKLVLKFMLRRNRTEADLLLEDEEGNQVSPMDSTGGGVVDVAAFALRIAMWTLSRPKLANTIILDEPFRFLSADLQDKASVMLKEISKKLDIQFVIITHEEELLDSADKIFRVTNRKGISYVSVSDLV